MLFRSVSQSRYRGQYLKSFTDIELNKGKIGIYVGADSKVKFDYLKITAEEKKDLNTLSSTDAKSIEESFTQIIVKLKDQINKKDKEIDDYKTRLKLCENGNGATRGNDTALLGQRNRLADQVETLDIENENLKTQLAQMEEELNQLKEFKKGIEKGNEDGDIIINLTNMVATQKTSIEELEKKNKSLNDENNSLFMETKDLTKQLDQTTVELTSERAKRIVISDEADSLRRVITMLKDSLNKKAMEAVKKPSGEKELTEEEKLQQMIEKEREERRKRKEEEERLRKEEEEKNNQGNG